MNFGALVHLLLVTFNQLSEFCVKSDEVYAASAIPFEPVLSAVAASRKQTTVERSSRQTALREVAVTREPSL